MTDLPSSSERRFGGIARLYGEAASQAFTRAHVAVVGVGGVGSWAVEALARSGIGELTLIDLDHVAESNINRQLQALEETLGMAKVGALAKRIAGINPACRVHCIEEMVEFDNLERLFDERFDYVIDCIDGYRQKAALIAHCRRRRIPLVTVGGAGGRIDPGRITTSDLSRSRDDPLLAKVRRLLRRDYGFPLNPKRRFEVPAAWSSEPPSIPPRDHCAASGLNCGGFGSAMPVTASFGLHAAAHVLRKLAG